jgi:acyl dehydratase
VTDAPDPEDLSVGDSAAPYVVEDVDRVDFAKYAGASGDFNPIHVDEPFAREAGSPSVFGHGMLTAGFVSTYLVDWFGIENVVRFRTRFEARLWPGDTVRVTGEVTDTSTSPTGTTVEVRLTAENGDGDELVTGDATVEL